MLAIGPARRRSAGRLFPMVASIGCSFCGLVSIAASAGAQGTPVREEGQQPGPPYSVRRTTDAIRLDALLSEVVWRQADSIVDLRQREPVEGAAASERTVVRLVRDAEHLYVAIRVYDRNVAGIRSTQLRRDADLTVDDNVTIIIDSFHDRRGAFMFRTNPNGAMWDAQLTGSENTNANWNGIWTVATARDSGGWTAEFRIPLRTLRFRAGVGVIGFNVQRDIRRKNEEVLWRSFGRAQGLRNLLYTGDIAGFGEVEQGRRFELRPYALGQVAAEAHDAAGAQIATGSTVAKVGLDAKTALSQSVTADLTVNTDFAQVEADRQVINLTRFPTFFPEKREFFLESSGLFDFGTSSNTQAFYSRRIGLRSGKTVPILGGARVYGKIGPWAIGAIDARTAASDQANDAVVRVKRDLFSRSYVGGIATQRSGPGVGGSQRTAGVDLDFPLVIRGHNLEPSFWVMGSNNAGVAGTPLAWRFGTDYPNDLFDNFISFYRVDDGFDPALGFVRRSGIWETTGHFNYSPRPGVLGIRQLEFILPIPKWDIIASRHGSLANTHDWQTAQFEWRFLGGELHSGDEFEANLQRFYDAPTDTFDLASGVTVAPARYWWTRGELQYHTFAGRPLSVGTTVSFGDFYNGRNRELSASATWRGGGHLILTGGIDHNTITLPSGRFTAVATNGRVEYAFSTRTDLLAFAQQNNEDQRIDFNVRFHWIPAIGDDLFIVWNSGYTTDPAAPVRFPARRVLTAPLNGAIVIKAVHRFAR